MQRAKCAAQRRRSRSGDPARGGAPRPGAHGVLAARVRQRRHQGARRGARLRRQHRDAADPDRASAGRSPTRCSTPRAGPTRTRPRTVSWSPRPPAQDTRLQVAVLAAQAYLAVIAAERQREIAVRNRDTARALEEYARARLEAGQGSRLEPRALGAAARQRRRPAGARRVRVSRAQEALGVAMFVDGPVGAQGEPPCPSLRRPRTTRG